MSYDAAWADSIEAKQGTLEQLADNVWWVWSVMASPPLPRNMVVVKLPSGGLLLHSPVCLPAEQMEALEALGPVEVIVVPNAGHCNDSRRFRARYPQALFVAPKNARKKVEEVVTVDAVSEDALPPLGITIHRPDGMAEGYELVYQVPLSDGGSALLVNDVLACEHEHHRAGGFAGWMLRLIGFHGPGIGQARIVRWMFGKDRKAFRRFVGGLATLEDVRLLLTSHGSPMRDPQAELEAAAARL